MGMILPFNHQQLLGLDSFQPLETRQNFRNMIGYEVTNLTPAFWEIYDDQGLLQKVVAPWQSVTDNFFQLSQYFIMKPAYDLPLLQVSQTTQRKLVIGFHGSPVSPRSSGLTIENMVNQITNHHTEQTTALSISGGRSGLLNVGTTETLIQLGAEPLPNRVSILLQNPDSNDESIYVGFAGVTVADGVEVKPGGTYEATITPGKEVSIYAVAQNAVDCRLHEYSMEVE